MWRLTKTVYLAPRWLLFYQLHNCGTTGTTEAVYVSELRLRSI